MIRIIVSTRMGTPSPTPTPAPKAAPLLDEGSAAGVVGVVLACSGEVAAGREVEAEVEAEVETELEVVVAAVVDAGVLEGFGVDVESGIVVRICAVPNVKRLLAVQMQPSKS
jgi:hypothetical protein